MGDSVAARGVTPDAPGLADLPVTDCHVHFAHLSLGAELVGVMEQLGISRLNVVCTPDRRRLSLVPDALHLKVRNPGRVYAFGGLDVSPLLLAPDEGGARFARYVDTLLEMGCDGIKMIEGKPEIRKMLPIPPFDADVWEPYWAKLVERRAPLIFHVNDPAEFWDPVRIPGWARDRGWFYGGGDFISNERQYAEVGNVLQRHPDLRVVFAHFFFLAGQLRRLAQILDRYANVHVDLTPGVEMYHSFSADPDAAREFFLRYQDRILFGTDIGAKALLATPKRGIELEESRMRVSLVRQFLESDAEFRLAGNDDFLLGAAETPFRGIALPRDVLTKIYTRNFERLAGATPRPLHPTAIAAECDRLARMIELTGTPGTGEPGDPSVAQQVQAFFTGDSQGIARRTKAPGLD